MDRSLFTIVDAYPEFADGSRDRYQELARLAEAADVAGLRTFWVAEHHFQSAGVDPAPPVLLAYLAARTRRIRLGPMVSVLPFHTPIELAEQYALLDRLLGGRLELGVGSGYIGLELEGFGVSEETRRSRFDGALAVMRSAWAGEPVRAADGAPPVRLNVLPVQRPHPPLWVAVQRKEAIPYVARMRANLALVPYATLGSVDELSELVRTYRASWPEGFQGRVGAALHTYVGSETDRARRHLQRFLDSRRATQSTFYLQKVQRDPRHASAEHLERTGLVALGELREVDERLEALASAGVDELLALVDFGGLPFEDARASAVALGRP